MRKKNEIKRRKKMTKTQFGRMVSGVSSLRCPCIFWCQSCVAALSDCSEEMVVGGYTLFN